MEILPDEEVNHLAIQLSKAGCGARRQNSLFPYPASEGAWSPRSCLALPSGNDSGTIFKGIQKISLLEYPGKIAAILFVGGCNFRCPFCYNRDLVVNPDGSRSLPEEEILEYLVARREWLDGVVVTGGEPTIHPSLPSFLEKVKQLGYQVKLDTNGSDSKMVAQLIERNLVDYIALDVKAPLLPGRYEKVAGIQCGGVIEEVENSIELLLGSNGVDYEFRTTVVPSLLSEEDILLIAERIKGAKRYYLQQFKRTNSHVDENYSSVAPYPLQTLQEIRMRIASNFSVCKVRGAGANLRTNPEGLGSISMNTKPVASTPKSLDGKNGSA